MGLWILVGVWLQIGMLYDYVARLKPPPDTKMKFRHNSSLSFSFSEVKVKLELSLSSHSVRSSVVRALSLLGLLLLFLFLPPPFFPGAPGDWAAELLDPYCWSNGGGTAEDL